METPDPASDAEPTGRGPGGLEPGGVEPGGPGGPGRRPGRDRLTIALTVYFLALIVIVVVLLATTTLFR